MIRDVLESFDLLVFSEIALLLFTTVFAAVLVRTLRTDKKTVARHASIVFGDEPRGGDR